MTLTEEQATKQQNWEFFCKEIAKGNEIITAYQLILDNMELNDSAYDPFFQLVLDSMTAKLVMIANYLFDTQSDSLKLSNVITNLDDINQIISLKNDCDDLIEFRHKKVGHIDKLGTNNKNFLMLTPHALSRISALFESVSVMLRKEGCKSFNGVVWASDWPNVTTSAQILFEHLEEGNIARNNLSNKELFAIRKQLKDK
jgi:hypothetical protein